MKKTKILSMLLFIGMIAGVISGCGKSGDSDVVELKLSHPVSTTHAYHLAAEMFKEKIEQETNGKVKITIFPTNQLGSQEEVTESVQLGTIDLAITSDDKLVNLVPDFGALGMPYLFTDTDQVCEEMNGAVGDLLSSKLKSKNIMVISWLENGFRQITNNRQPIDKPEDLKGIKIRTSSTKPNMEAFNTFGASATNISFNELYSALQLNTVDAQENPLSNILDKKFYEVQKYLSISNHVHTTEPMIMAQSSYDKLTDEQKEIFERVGKEVSEWAFQNSKENYEDQLQQLKDNGMEVNEVDVEAFKTACEPVYDEFYDQYKEVIDMVRAQEETK